MTDYLSKIQPHYDTTVKPEAKVNNLNRGTISVLVEIIRKNQEMLDELKKQNENLRTK